MSFFFTTTMRKSLAIFSLAVILGCITFLFYFQEVQYWLPTPIPKGFQTIAIGSEVELLDPHSGKKKFIHFYNPNCPCSKFNQENYRALLRDYNQKFDCYVVIQKTLDGLNDEEQTFLSGLGASLIVDTNKEIAKAFGVYATPQIVLTDESNKIYYRGNYNQSRYCTQPATNYAKIAIDSLLSHSQYLFPPPAFTAYGCDLNKPTD